MLFNMPYNFLNVIYFGCIKNQLSHNSVNQAYLPRADNIWELTKTEKGECITSFVLLILFDFWNSDGERQKLLNIRLAVEVL